MGWPTGCDFTNLRVFQVNGLADEEGGDDPDEREEEDAEQEPRQRESTDPLGHEIRSEEVAQRQSQQGNEKNGGAINGQAQLTGHQLAKERFAVNTIGLGLHPGGLPGNDWCHKPRVVRLCRWIKCPDRDILYVEIAD